MKRKKWSELEEQTLLSKYSDLLNSGILSKLKTREKKFRPIAEHVNSLHHLQDPITFPFKWSWRDVSIKVQNMRHQYVGVKQKIRISSDEFNWADGEIHWVNFLKYKEVFGDVELSDNNNNNGVNDFSPNLNTVQKIINSKKLEDEGNISDIFGYQIDSDEETEDAEGFDEHGEGGETGAKDEKSCRIGDRKLKKIFKKKRLRMTNAKVLELRDVIMRREEKRREREWANEVASMEDEAEREEMEIDTTKRVEKREERIRRKESELEEMMMSFEKREIERRFKLEREVEEERSRRMKLQERLEMEEMEWRERMVEMQTQHEKRMMQMHADACHSQMQVLGVVARLVCQLLGSGNDGLGTRGLENLQDPGGIGDGGKPNAGSPSEFL